MRHIYLTPERLRGSQETGHQGSEHSTFCSAPSLWPPRTSAILSEGGPLPPAETGPTPAVRATCKYLLKPPSMNSSVLRLLQHSCGQLYSASSPDTDFAPDDSCPLKILETTRNTLHFWETGSTKRAQRKAMTFEEWANISPASFYWNRYIMEINPLDSPTHIYFLVPLLFILFLSGGRTFRRRTLSYFIQYLFFFSFSVQDHTNNVGYSPGMLSQFWIGL